MLSARLLDRIETHWDKIADAVVFSAHADERFAHYRALEDEELRTRARDLIANLRLWLTGKDDTELEERYRRLGSIRMGQGFPLHEIVGIVQLIERKTLDYVRDANSASNAVELYGELEMIRVLNRYFQIVQLSLVEGFEVAARNQSAWTAARAS